MPLKTHYTEEELAERKYSVYLDGIRQEHVVEVDLDEERIVINELRYTGWGKVEVRRPKTKYGRIHLVVEEVYNEESENLCNNSNNCNDGDCDDCSDYDVGDGSHI